MPGDDARLSRVLAALRASGDVTYHWDFACDRIEWSGPVEEVLAQPDLSSISTGDRFHDLINSDDLARRLKALSRHFSSRGRFDCEYRLRCPDGTFRWVHERGEVTIGTDGKPETMTGTLRAITARKLSEERLEYLANFDELTGHFNRSRLKSAIEHALSRSRRYGRSGAYLVLDVDNLALINDAYGAETGDAVIVALGERLDRLIGASDVIGRVEGDEFGIVLDDCDENVLQQTAERIIRAVREEPFPTRIGAVAVTVSLGGLIFPDSAQTGHDVMSRAESALHTAKRAGRNHFMLYRLTEVQRLGIRQDMGIAKQVQRALAEERLEFAYQPIVRADTGTPEFHECLLRMRKHDGQLVSAGQFIPVVEQLGLMRQIDRRVLEMVVHQLHEDPGAVLAFNISGLTASDQSWLRGLVALLKGKPEVASRLIVEITETAALQDIDDSERFVTTVRDLGCKVALDDFGAGYSSFRHLKALAVDMVKIDGSFVGNLMDRAENQLFVRTLLGLARGFGLATVAECVETADEAALLVQEGVTYLQGYYFGRPEASRLPCSANLLPCLDRAVLARSDGMLSRVNGA